MRTVSAASVVYLHGMGGLGDSIYQRPLVRVQAAQATTYLSTPWPELYGDIPGLHFIAPWRMRLRTQEKNIARQPTSTWSDTPAHNLTRTFWYSLSPARGPHRTILNEMSERAGLRLPEPLDFSLPDFGPSPVETAQPIAVLRPVTTRKEWMNNARAPMPEYIARAAALLQARGFHVVAVADIEPPAEWLEGEMPPADLHLTAGELNTSQLLALIQNAAVVVGGVGFIVPAALAAHVPAVFISGGQGGHNAPELLGDPRIDASRTRWVLPDRYCRCRNRAHACDKTISDFDARFTAALEEVAA